MSLRATNVSHGKLVNLWVVFETIRLHGPLARSDIARLTNLSKPSVSNLVDELDEMGLIRHGALRLGLIGKPSTPLDLNPEGAFTIGLHLDFRRVTAVITDLVGNVRRREVWRLETRDQARTLTEIVARIGVLRRKADVDPERLVGVGLVMPGPFGVAGLWPTRLHGWDGLVIRPLLESALGLPVMLANDGTGAAVAEWRFGQARGRENFVYVFIGNGIGAVSVSGGRLTGGASGNAGELAHIVVQPGGHSCVCGKRGCLETYVSLDSALRHLARHGTVIASMEEFEQRIAHDDPLIEAWIEESVEPLRLGLNTLENLFDPETIYIGGDFPPWLLDIFAAQVRPLPVSVAVNRTMEDRLQRAALGQDAAAIGAASLTISAALNPDERHRMPLGTARPPHNERVA
jgi:predicted NBD/HSP70 family sugar kinase